MKTWNKISLIMHALLILIFLYLSPREKMKNVNHSILIMVMINTIIYDHLLSLHQYDISNNTIF